MAEFLALPWRLAFHALRFETGSQKRRRKKRKIRQKSRQFLANGCSHFTTTARTTLPTGKPRALRLSPLGIAGSRMMGVSGNARGACRMLTGEG